MTKRLEELVELALRKELTIETRTELVKILFTDTEGDIDLSELQLQDFDGDLYQDSQIVKGDLIQNFQVVEGDLYQNMQKVKGDLSQGCQKVKGYAFINSNKFSGIKEWKNDRWVITKQRDPYIDMSREELIEELKKVKGESND